MNDFQLANWIPYKITKSNDQLLCYWLNTFGQPFTEPFFAETILKCRVMNGQHAKMASVSDLGMVIEWADALGAVMPAAFIFHISRCGSTLVSQLLATNDQCVILSEVPFFDDVLRLPFKEQNFDQARTAEFLDAAIRLYGQPGTRCGPHVVIKTDSWHIFFYEQLRKRYPLTPFILMYRRPDEVFNSHSKVKGMQAVPGLIEPQVFAFDPEEIVYNDLQGYLARVLERYLTKYLQIIETDKQCLLVNYIERPMPIVKKVAAVAGIELSERNICLMERRSLYQSKNPLELFREEKKAPTPDCLQNAMALYDELEQIRTRH